MAGAGRSAIIVTAFSPMLRLLALPDDGIVTTLMLVALATGFLAAFRLGPLAIVPIAGLCALAAFLFSVEFRGSPLFAAVGSVLAANVGYLAGAAILHFALRSPAVRSLLSSRWFTR